LAAAVPGQYTIHGADGVGVFGWATGLLALTLGVRHAFDVDHIAAIDNTTRKLAADGKRPLAVGFFFSLGHSAIVFVMTVLLSFGIAALNSQVQNEGSVLHQVTDVIGPVVSGTFLVVIGVTNVFVAIAIVRVSRRIRAGDVDHSHLDAELNKRGAMNRMFGRFADRIDASWKIYPLGALFGLGFDTVTEISLLVLSGATVLAGLPWWAVLSLPLLFAAGMCLFDTLDGLLMNFAYGWAFVNPTRKVYYNVVITVMSAGIALAIGLVQLGSFVADAVGISIPAFEWFHSLEFLGYAVVGVLITTWFVSMVIWKIGKFEQRATATG
jgi:nickel/cobalt transporter (NiCoT) family protein